MAQKEKVPSLYLHVSNASRFQELEDDIAVNGYASEAIVDFSTQNTGSTYVGILFVDSSFPTHICRLSRRQKAATARRKMNCSDIVAINNEQSQILLESIQSSLKGKRTKQQLKNIGRLNPAENRDVLRKIEERDEQLAENLRLLGRADSRMLMMYSPKEREVLALERDAIGLALDIAFNNRESLRVHYQEERVDDFLSLVDGVSNIEDEFIAYDKERFLPDMKKLEATPRRVTFENNGSKLEIIHANRTKLETTLGVDLIYFAPNFGLLLGVQYKMMEKRSDRYLFVPDKGFHPQLDKMKSIVDSVIGIPPSDKDNDFRLNSIPFFYKFVSRLESNFADKTLCSGLYMPLELVSQMTKANPIRPIELLHEKQTTRYLTNTDFASLVRDGWIGSYSTQRIVFENLIKEAIEGKRSVTIAIKTTS